MPELSYAEENVMRLMRAGAEILLQRRGVEVATKDESYKIGNGVIVGLIQKGYLHEDLTIRKIA